MTAAPRGHAGAPPLPVPRAPRREHTGDCRLAATLVARRRGGAPNDCRPPTGKGARVTAPHDPSCGHEPQRTRAGHAALPSPARDGHSRFFPTEMTRVTAASPTFSATATRVAQPSLSAGAFGASTFPDEMTRVTATSPTFGATATRIARPSLSTGAFGVNPPAHPLATNGVVLKMFL